MALKYEDRYRKWIAFYRQNPHRFVRDYFNVRLYFFQKMIFVLMHKYPTFALLACRGISKTFIVALYSTTIAVLYPGSKIVLTSGTKTQAQDIIELKIKGEFIVDYPNIDREIARIVVGDKPKVDFYNGSTILARPPRDSARGPRATINIYDECRLIPERIVDDVFEPMKIGAKRGINLFSKKIGKEVKDTALKSIYMTSGWYQSNWAWKRFSLIYEDMIKGMREGIDPNGVALSFPYHIAIMYGLTDKKTMKEKMRKQSRIPFLMEYEGEFYGESGNSFFKMEMFEQNRKSIKPFQLKTTIDINLSGDGKDLERYLKSEADKMPRVEGEIRLMSVDTAPSTSDGSDNNIVVIARLIPEGLHYKKYIVNIKRMENDVSSVLTKYIKRWYYAFQCDQCALDTQGTSFAVFEEVVKATYDNELDCEYPAWKVMAGNGTEKTVLENMARTKTSNFEDVLYSINATDRLNHIIASKLRAALEEGNKIELLPTSEIGRDIILEKFNGSIDPLVEAELLEPYIGTDSMISESVLLEKQVKENGFIKLKTSSSTSKKDRYVALAYLYYLASLYDNLLEESFEEVGGGYFVN